MEPHVNPESRNAMAAYQRVAAHGGVASADPHRLVTMLFDAIVERLTAAIGCLEQGDIGRKARLLHNAVSLVAELRGSLNHQGGGELARNLDALYEYMIRRLLLANAGNDARPVREVLRLIGEIREAWLAIGPQVRAGGTAASAAQVAPTR